MRALDLFAGPGGWDEGIRELGIEPLGIEWDEQACRTRLAAGHQTLCADVSALNPDDFRDVGGTPPELLLASPPCQAFSAAGKKRGNLDRDLILAVMHRLALGHDDRAEAASKAHDARSMLTVEPLRFALTLRPRFIAFEQVPGVLPLWEETATILGAHGYATWTGKVSAEEYGVPQTRKRAILLASLDGAVSPPTPTHTAYKKGEPRQKDGRLPWVSMAEALGWGATERPYPTLSGGTTGGPCYDFLGGSGARKTMLCERREQRWAWPYTAPATTIAGDPRITARCHHYPGQQGSNPKTTAQVQAGDYAGTEPIRLTVAEASVLQTFPADYPWQGTKTSIHLQVGNAVPPLLARVIVGGLVGASISEREAA